MKNTVYVLIALFLFSAVPFASFAGIEQCDVVRSIGKVHVKEKNFAGKIRKLRHKCRLAKDRYEEAEVQWEGRGVYSCNVGSFCNKRFP